MKKFTKWYSTAKLYKVFLINFLFFGVIMFSLMYLASSTGAIADPRLKMLILVYLPVVFSLMSASLLTMVESKERKSKIFWKVADEFDKKLNEVKIMKDLEELSPDWEELKKLSIGGYHDAELNRLNTIASAIKKYIK